MTQKYFQFSPSIINTISVKPLRPIFFWKNGCYKDYDRTKYLTLIPVDGKNKDVVEKHEEIG